MGYFLCFGLFAGLHLQLQGQMCQFPLQLPGPSTGSSLNPQNPHVSEHIAGTHDCPFSDILQYMFYRKLWISTLFPSSGQSRNQQWFEGQVTGCSHLWKAINSGTHAWKRYIMTWMFIWLLMKVQCWKPFLLLNNFVETLIHLVSVFFDE